MTVFLSLCSDATEFKHATVVKSTWMTVASYNCCIIENCRTESLKCSVCRCRQKPEGRRSTEPRREDPRRGAQPPPLPRRPSRPPPYSPRRPTGPPMPNARPPPPYLYGPQGMPARPRYPPRFGYNFPRSFGPRFWTALLTIFYSLCRLRLWHKKLAQNCNCCLLVWELTTSKKIIRFGNGYGLEGGGVLLWYALVHLFSCELCKN